MIPAIILCCMTYLLGCVVGSTDSNDGQATVASCVLALVIIVICFTVFFTKLAMSQ